MNKKYLGKSIAKKSRFIRYLENLKENEKLIIESKIAEYGLERFGPKFCHNDIIVYGELPRTDFIRTKTSLMEMMLVISNSLGTKRTRHSKGAKVFSYVEF